MDEDVNSRVGLWKHSNTNLTFFSIQHQSTPVYLPLLSQLVGACRVLSGNEARDPVEVLLERIGTEFSARWAEQMSSY